ncbi:hypothetical protein TNCV_2050861 [Trichonephila clavipes]|nr:hypothetical protein TNCV_2050861 [Trichonephila clavipes]
MEKMVQKQLLYHPDSWDLVPKEQYGLGRGHFTIDTVLYLCQRIRGAQNISPANHTVAAFLDLSKAFYRDTCRKGQSLEDNCRLFGLNFYVQTEQQGHEQADEPLSPNVVMPIKLSTDPVRMLIIGFELD